LPQVLGPPRFAEIPRLGSILPTRDFLLGRKFGRQEEARRGLPKVGLIFSRLSAMVDCAAQ
jgi:hypothetical protein